MGTGSDGADIVMRGGDRRVLHYNVGPMLGAERRGGHYNVKR